MSHNYRPRHALSRPRRLVRAGHFGRLAARTGLAGFAAASIAVAAPASATPASAAGAVTAQPAVQVAHFGPVLPARRAPQHVVHGRAIAHTPAPVVHVDHVAQALAIATAQMGKPYVWGTVGPSAFDCSGLTSYAYHLAGFDLPRTAAEQASYVPRIDRSQIQPGDFVFFYSGDHVYHVGLFDGYEGGVPYIVHAPHPGADVRREAIWTDAWFAGSLR